MGLGIEGPVTLIIKFARAPDIACEETDCNLFDCETNPKDKVSFTLSCLESSERVQEIKNIKQVNKKIAFASLILSFSSSRL